ncbi:MAG: hypothetical protein QNJ32_03795 [Xenococcaceae cyanobacterium MO_167.B27]|nr:hypothetical protein [Xenococcaceae cyanobacterium MO_167.B27]
MAVTEADTLNVENDTQKHLTIVKNHEFSMSETNHKAIETIV